MIVMMSMVGVKFSYLLGLGYFLLMIAFDLHTAAANLCPSALPVLPHPETMGGGCFAAAFILLCAAVMGAIAGADLLPCAIFGVGALLGTFRTYSVDG